MKALFYITCIVLIVGCRGKVNSVAIDSVPDKPAAENVMPVKKAEPVTIKYQPDTTYKVYGYTLSDTGYFDFDIGEGLFALLKKDGKIIDTIDAEYGVNRVEGDKFMYVLVNEDGPLAEEYRNSKYSKSIHANVGSFIIIDNSLNKTDVSTLAPDFGWFAAPSILNGKVFYYRVKEVKQAPYLVSAGEFDPITRETQSHYLFKDYIDTDDGGHFKPAELINGLIVFEDTQGKQYKFSKDFKLIK